MQKTAWTTHDKEEGQIRRGSTHSELVTDSLAQALLTEAKHSTSMTSWNILDARKTQGVIKHWTLSVGLFSKQSLEHPPTDPCSLSKPHLSPNWNRTDFSSDYTVEQTSDPLSKKQLSKLPSRTQSRFSRYFSYAFTILLPPVGRSLNKSKTSVRLRNIRKTFFFQFILNQLFHMDYCY